MRLSNLAIALATVATVPAAYAAELATTTDFQKISEELAVEEQKITDEIKTLEAELDTQATTDGTTTRTVDGGSTEPTETTTEEKTLTTTITEPCPMQATVMCDEKHDTVTKEVNGCTYTECVPKETTDPSLCDGANDLSLTEDGMSCTRYLTTAGCYEYTCERSMCLGAQDLTSQTDGVKCTAQLTSAGCYDYRCETIVVDPPPLTYCEGSLIPEEDATCKSQTYTKTERDGCIFVDCLKVCSYECRGGTVPLTGGSGDCADYTCVKKGGKTADGGGDTTDGTDGGGGKTKVCKGRNCKRKNLRA